MSFILDWICIYGREYYQSLIKPKLGAIALRMHCIHIYTNEHYKALIFQINIFPPRYTFNSYFEIIIMVYRGFIETFTNIPHHQQCISLYTLCTSKQCPLSWCNCLYYIPTCRNVIVFYIDILLLLYTISIKYLNGPMLFPMLYIFAATAIYTGMTASAYVWQHIDDCTFLLLSVRFSTKNILPGIIWFLSDFHICVPYSVMLSKYI